MQLIFKTALLQHYAKQITRRLIHYALIVALSFQLIAETQHHHDITQQSDNCIACYVSAQATGDGPAVALKLPLAIRLITHFVTPNIYNSLYIPFSNYILPHSQAPPKAL